MKLLTFMFLAAAALHVWPERPSSYLSPQCVYLRGKVAIFGEQQIIDAARADGATEKQIEVYRRICRTRR